MSQFINNVDKTITVLENIIKNNLIKIDKINKIKNNSKTLVIGIGSSYSSAKITQEHLQRTSQDNFEVIEPLGFIQNSKYFLDRYDFYILLSQSGTSTVISECFNIINKENKNMTYITSDVDMPKKTTSLKEDMIIRSMDIEETVAFKSVGMSATILNLILLFDSSNKDIEDSIKELATLDTMNKFSKKTIDSFSKDTTIWFISDYYDIALAKEMQLKINEMCYMKSISSSLESFAHGQEGAVSKNDMVIVIDNSEHERLNFISNNEIKDSLKKLNNTNVHFLVDKETKINHNLTKLFFKLLSLQYFVGYANIKLKYSDSKIKYRYFIEKTKIK